MRKHIIIFIALLFTWGVTPTAIFAADDVCPGPQYNSNGSCKSCPEGFRAGNDDQESKITGCYGICSSEEMGIANGQPNNNARKHYSENSGDNDNDVGEECTPTCDGTGTNCNFTCNEYFHPECNYAGCMCLANYNTCTELSGYPHATKGGRYWNNGDYGTCYPIECDSGYHLENTNQFPNGRTYGECVNNITDCSEDKVVVNACQDQATTKYGTYISVSGQKEFNGTEHNVTACRCTIQESVECANAEMTYSYTDRHTVSNGFTNRQDISCSAGCCRNGDNVCAQPAKGYTTNNGTCTACPDGQTTDIKAWSDDKVPECGTDFTGTRFCDGTGKCFTLKANFVPGSLF